jgi:hypothetical protein
MVISGPENVENWPQYTAFGSWVSNMLKRSYDQVYQVVTKWAPTRFLAAEISLAQASCSVLVAPYIANTTQGQEICATYDFSNLTNVFDFALAPKDSAMQAALM